MSKYRNIIAAAFMLIAHAISACWYPTYEPQYYLTYNIIDNDTESLQSETDMVRIWQKLLPGVSREEIKKLIYSDGYTVEDIQTLNLTTQLKTTLGNNNELYDYIVLMRETETECARTADPWYFYYDDDPKLQRLDSLAIKAKSRLSGKYGDRYAIQAARALRALKKYPEIITIAETHQFKDSQLKSIFDQSLASAYYYTGAYEQALEFYQNSGDETSLRWTLEKLGMDANNLALARQLSSAPGNDSAIMRLLQAHIRQMELASDKEASWYWNGLSLPEIGEVISVAKDAAENGLECYKPIWQYTEGFAYLISPVDYEKADSVFFKINPNAASPHLKEQIRTLRFITQSYLLEYDDTYKTWFAGEADWLCKKGTEIIDRKRIERAEKVGLHGYDTYSHPEEWHPNFCENVIFFRNTHQSYCYPLDMLHRAADCIVVPKMLAANDTISALQLLDLVDHAGLSAEEIRMADSHGCASICFAMECGADVVTAAKTSLNANNSWSSLIKHNGSITRHSDRWNDLIGTLLIAETRYAEAAETFETVSDKYGSNIYDTGKNPFALQFISDPFCRSGETKMQPLSPNHKKWFAQRMTELKQTMDNVNKPGKERAMAGIDYYTGIANSVYPCWSLTRYGEGSSPFFPYQIPNQPIGKRATEIIHDYMCEEYFPVDQPSKFNRSYQRLKILRQESIKNIKEQIALLDDNEAAEILLKIGQYLTIKHHYADTDIANRLKSSCDRWSDW